MKRIPLFAWVSVLVIGLLAGITFVSQRKGSVDQRQVEIRERVRLTELRVKQTTHEDYWKRYNPENPATAPAHFSADDAAELAELERRQAKRAVDRVGNP